MIDLHTHSTASDGSLSPRELVRCAVNNGLTAIALTDHDTVDGIPDAFSEADAAGIEVIPGVEISVDFKPEMHILGYFNGSSYQNIADTLALLRRSREERNPKIISKLIELGYDITMDEVKEAAGGRVVARPHFAKVLVAKGYFHNVEEAFHALLLPGKPAYFRKEKLTPREGIAEILRAGGVPVLAHPIYLYMEESQLDQLFAELKAVGLAGIEAYYVDNTPEDTAMLVSLAKKHGLLTTGGSDFHGAMKPAIAIGRGRGNLVIPESILEELKRLTHQVNG